MYGVVVIFFFSFFFFSSRRRHTRLRRDWSSDVCSSDLRSFPALSKNQLPDRIPAFFGRKDVVLEVMGRSWEGGGPICLYGENGSGKTSLAVDLAHQLAPKYPDAQFYIDFKVGGDKPLPVSKAMGHVLRAFFPKEPLPSDPAEMAQQYGAALKGKRVLMVLENVSKLSQIKRLMLGKSSLVIFTSGNKISIPGSYAKDRKSTRLNSSHVVISYAVFCLKKKKKN